MECNNFFDTLKNITEEKDINALGTKHFSPYMMNRFLSMKSDYLYFANLMNRYYDIPKEYQEILLFHLLPKKRVFLKYIKDSAKNNLKELKEKIIKEHQCSEKKAEEIIYFYNKLQDKRNGL